MRRWLRGRPEPARWSLVRGFFCSSCSGTKIGSRERNLGSKEWIVAHPSRKVAELPSEVEEVFREFRTCEMSTFARDGTPITWPTLPFWKHDEGRFMITTSISLAQKAFNVRRNPRVSLLFSNPTASGLHDPPAVLVQADAEAPDEIVTSVEGFEDELRMVYQRQPSSRVYSSNPLTRYC